MDNCRNQARAAYSVLSSGNCELYFFFIDNVIFPDGQFVGSASLLHSARPSALRRHVRLNLLFLLLALLREIIFVDCSDGKPTPSTPPTPPLAPLVMEVEEKARRVTTGLTLFCLAT